MFVKTVRKSTLSAYCLLIACLAAGWLLLKWPQAASSGISRGLSICSSIIIPSLFPFLVLAGFLVKSGLSASIGRRLEGPTRFLFGLPGCCAPGILVSFIGGYPAGGIAVGELVKQGVINREQGRRMLSFSVNGGPAFIISAVGAGMLGSVKYGVMLYCAHIAASVLLGIFLRIGTQGKENESNDTQIKTIPRPRISPASAFVDAVGTACHSLLLMCGFIIFFAAVLSLADASGFSDLLQSHAVRSSELLKNVFGCIFPCLIEVSCGSVEAARVGAAAPLMLGMALGWGGLSVHCQIAAVLQGQKLIGKSFFASRFLHSMLGGLFSMLLFRAIPVAVTTFKPLSEAKVVPFYSNAAASAALLALCALFLFTAAGRNTEVVSKIRSGKIQEDML